MTTPTNILALPMASMIIDTGTNEDWIDAFVYLVDEDAGVQLDLRGIEFEMEVRRRPEDHEVIISGSTKDGKLSLGQPPDFGYVIIRISVEEMRVKTAGQYVGDIVATDAENSHRCISFTLNIVEGITR